MPHLRAKNMSHAETGRKTRDITGIDRMNRMKEPALKAKSFFPVNPVHSC
jgi:hypothetical protein